LTSVDQTVRARDTKRKSIRERTDPSGRDHVYLRCAPPTRTVAEGVVQLGVFDCLQQEFGRGVQSALGPAGSSGLVDDTVKVTAQDDGSVEVARSRGSCWKTASLSLFTAGAYTLMSLRGEFLYMTSATRRLPPTTSFGYNTLTGSSSLGSGPQTDGGEAAVDVLIPGARNRGATSGANSGQVALHPWWRTIYNTGITQVRYT